MGEWQVLVVNDRLTAVGDGFDRPTRSTEGLQPRADGRPSVSTVSRSGDRNTSAGDRDTTCRAWDRAGPFLSGVAEVDA